MEYYTVTEVHNMLDKIRTFVAVVDMKGFSRSAAALNLTQPAVSKQVSSLESLFGVRLLERSGRQVAPTDAGDMLYSHARVLLEAEARLKEAMATLSPGRTKVLHVGASTVPGQYILPCIIAPFLSRYPGVMIDIRIADTRETGDRLMSGEIDLAVTGWELEGTGIISRALFEDEILLAVPAEHRLATEAEVSVEELTGEPFIWREKGSATRRALEDAFKEHINRFNRVVEMGTTEAIVSAVQAGAGLAFLSQWAISRGQRAGTLRALRVKEFTVKRDFYGCYLKARECLGHLTLFLDYLEEAGRTLRGSTGTPGHT